MTPLPPDLVIALSRLNAPVGIPSVIARATLRRRMAAQRDQWPTGLRGGGR